MRDPAGLLRFSLEGRVVLITGARGGLAGAVLAGRLYVFGGEGNKERSSGVFPDIDAYDPSTNTWEKLAPMFAPRHGYGAATLNGRIYLAGGARGVPLQITSPQQFTFTGDPGFGSSLAALFGTAPVSP